MTFVRPQRPVAPWSEHGYWGQYTDAMSLPNMAGADIQTRDLQRGDLAWSEDDSQLYQCNDPTPGSAAWSPLALGGLPGLLVQDEGANIPNNPHDTLNVVGPGISASDAGAGVADLTITPGTPVEITDTTNAEGVADALARSDHQHAHGNRGGGSLHSLVVPGGAAGFMSGADKQKLDTLVSSILVFGQANVGQTPTVRYMTPGYGDGLGPTHVRAIAVAAGTLGDMRVVHNDPGGNGGLITYTVIVNGAPTTLSVTMASTASLGTDLVNQVAVGMGDLVDIRISKGGNIGGSNLDVTATIRYV